MMASSTLLTPNQLCESNSEEHRSSNRDSVGDTRSSSCGSCDDHAMDAVSCGSDASDCLQPITMETNPIFQHSPDSGTFGSLRDADLHLAPSELRELHQRNQDALLQHEINMNLGHGLQCMDIGQHDMHDLEENDNVSIARTHLDDKLSEKIGNGISNVELLKACKLDFQQKLDPHSLSLPVPIQNSERKKRHCSVEDPSLDALSSADSDLSRSLPHGTIVQKGDMIEFIADNLVEKIKRSSSLSIADSSSLHTRTSSVQSFGSISSTNSAYSVSRTSYSAVSQSPSSLVPQSPDDIPPVDPHALIDLEIQAKQVADRLDCMMSSLKSNLHKMSALTSGCLDAYKKSVDSTCDAVDANIKSMYALMAKCEELGKSMTPIYQLANQIKEIKRLLDIFENKLVDRS
ncbi:uncharacterized protein LOC115212096 [Argonauta hians]